MIRVEKATGQVLMGVFCLSQTSVASATFGSKIATRLSHNIIEEKVYEREETKLDFVNVDYTKPNEISPSPPKEARLFTDTTCLVCSGVLCLLVV